MKRLVLTLLCIAVISCFSFSAVAEEPAKENKADKVEQCQKDDAKKDEAQKDDSKEEEKKDESKKEEEPKKEEPKKEDAEKNVSEAKEAPAQDAAKEEVKKDDNKPEEKKADPKKEEESKKDEAKKDEAKKEDAKKEDTAKADAKKEEPKKEEPKTIEVKKDEIHICVDLKGVFESRKSTEIKIEPKQWSSFKILRTVEHGQKISRGDLLVAFDPEKIDEAIADGRRELAIARLNLQKAEKEYAAFEKMLPTNQKVIARAMKELREDQTWEDAHDRKIIKEDLEIFFKMISFDVESAREEYEQLKKMYEADNLTEDTEEIILKRTKLQFEQAEFMFKYYKSQYDFMKKYGLDRFEKSYEENQLRERLSTEQQVALFPLTVELKKITMEKQRIEFEQAKEKFDELQADRKLMTVKAPCDGVVYYGYCRDGKWNGATAGTLEKDKAVAAQKVFMTIVNTDSLQVHSSVSEKDLPLVREGLKATARATVLPETQLQLLVDQVATIPSSGSFDVVLKMIGKTPECIVPGMSCDIRAIGYYKKDALVIPATAIETDPLDDAKHFVYRIDKAEKDKDDKDKEVEPKKIQIRKGKTVGKQVEILSGLKAGDKILPEPPKEDEE